MIKRSTDQRKNILVDFLRFSSLRGMTPSVEHIVLLPAVKEPSCLACQKIIDRLEMRE
jgi:hypothetical protein